MKQNENIEVRTRFAPSPTGFMHVGNLRTALYAYLIARSNNGKFVLRIEDTDQQRFVDGAVEVIYKTLNSAKLIHDEGPDVGGEYGPYIQSERKELYKKYAEELVKNGSAYYCFCDKNDCEETDEEQNSGYNRHCRELSQETIVENLTANKPYVIRQKIDIEGSTTFDDMVFGSITIENKVLDDQILLKRDGMPTYNFANVVDDYLMNITHVVRGSEYLPSTPKYNLLYKAFGWELPKYVHLPLIMGRAEDGTISKLSKRHGSVSFETLVSEGYLPEAIINYISLLGWSSKSERELFTLKELEENFDISGLNKAPAVFDYTKLKWMNGEYIKQLDFNDFKSMAFDISGVAGTFLESKWDIIAELMQSRITLFSEIPSKISFLFERPEFSEELFVNKKNKCDITLAKTILEQLIPELELLSDWNRDLIKELLDKYVQMYHMKSVMWAVRIALAGQTVTPGGAIEIMEILEKNESIRRLKSAF